MENDFAKLKEICRQFSNGLMTTNPADISALLSRLEGKVYGRICSSPGPEIPPYALTSTKGRNIVFALGHDGLSLVLQQETPFDALIKLGFLKEYINYDVNVLHYGSWLVLFLPSKASIPFTLYPATWDGILKTIRDHYPLLVSEFEINFQQLKERPYKEFEEDAKFRFIESLKCFKRGDKNGPPYFDYQYTCSLPRPLSCWQLRAFLYCELRLLELFDGCGRTRIESSNQLGPCEYMCPTVPFSSFNSDSMEMVSLKVVVPP